MKMIIANSNVIRDLKREGLHIKTPNMKKEDLWEDIENSLCKKRIKKKLTGNTEQ